MNWLYNWLVVNPVRKLYFSGPVVYGYGFWGGREPEDICAELTGVSARHWSDNRERCVDLLEKQLYAVVIAVETFAHLWILYKVLNLVSRVVLWKLRITPESWSQPPPVTLKQRSPRRRRHGSPQAKTSSSSSG